MTLTACYTTTMGRGWLASTLLTITVIAFAGCGSNGVGDASLVSEAALAAD